MEERYNQIFLGPVLFSTFFAWIQSPWPLLPSILMLARWELGFWQPGIFSLHALEFSVWELIKCHCYQKSLIGFSLFYHLRCAPDSLFSVPLPHAAPATGTVTTGPCVCLQILGSVSVGLLHFSSLDWRVGVSHLHMWSKASNFICHTGEQPHGPVLPSPLMIVSVCKRAYISYSNLKLSGRKDTGAWLRPIQLLYWRQSKESNDTLLWKLSRNVKNAFALFLLLLLSLLS